MTEPYISTDSIFIHRAVLGTTAHQMQQ